MRRTIIDEVMAEHIFMPGFLDMIVHRGFAYQWLKDCGWNPSERGFGSLDYQVFSKRPVEYPLTEDAIRDTRLNEVRADFIRED